MGKNDDKSNVESTGSLFKHSEPKKYEIIFKENRSYELYVGRMRIVFAPMGVQKVDSWVINHPDFIQQKDKFLVREV